MQNRELKPYNNFIKCGNWVAYTCTFERGKLVHIHLIGKTCSKELNLVNNCDSENHLTPRGLSALSRDYIHEYDHHFKGLLL